LVKTTVATHHQHRHHHHHHHHHKKLKRREGKKRYEKLNVRFFKNAQVGDGTLKPFQLANSNVLQSCVLSYTLLCSK